MSFAIEYALLQDFLQADPDWARLDAECSRLQAIVNKQGKAAHSATCDFHAYSLCQETLEYAVHDIPDFTPDNLALFNGELAACYYDTGAKVFERLKRECMIKGGKAAEKWAKASDELSQAECERQDRRLELIAIWDEMEAKKKAADQEAK
jgi:hypothetical protein